MLNATSMTAIKLSTGSPNHSQCSAMRNEALVYTLLQIIDPHDKESVMQFWLHVTGTWFNKVCYSLDIYFIFTKEIHVQRLCIFCSFRWNDF